MGGWVVSGRGSLVSPDPALGSRKRRRRGEKRRRRRSPAPSLPPRIQAPLGAEGLEEASAPGEFHSQGASGGTRAETQQYLQRVPQKERGAATGEPAAAAAAGRDGAPSGALFYSSVSPVGGREAKVKLPLEPLFPHTSKTQRD